jgi:parallel beta-helix repeat protein
VACSGCATAFTGYPDAVRGTEARVTAYLLTNTGGQVEYWTQYGTTPQYGSATTHQTKTLNPNQQDFVYGQISGLGRSTTYHYRVCAQDSQQQGGPGCGEDKTFTTPNLDCGDVITHDVTLTASLDCNPYSFDASGLAIGADGVDLNLGGNLMRGPLMTEFDSSVPVAIDNTGGYDDVTIRNGSLARWGTIAELKDADYNVIRNLRGVTNGAGVYISGGEGNVIRSTDLGLVGRFANGLRAQDTDGLVVADSSGGPTWSLTGSNARIVRNQLTSGDEFSLCFDVRGNRNLIADNRIAGCPFGGLVVSSGSNNELISNEVSGAVPGFSGSQPDGIRVEAFTAGTLLQSNFVHDNDDDGIDVRATSVRLQGNRADDNGDFGIDAVAGVTDLGGNTASGNGNALQCRNVFCAASP